MPGVILSKTSPDSITVSMAASAAQQPYDSPDEGGIRNPREAREARKAARAAKGRNQNANATANHFNGGAATATTGPPSSHSPTRDDYRYADGEEPYSPTEESVLQESLLSSQPSAAVPRGPDGRRSGDQGALPPGYSGYDDGAQSPVKNGHYRSQHQGASLPSNRRHSANPGAPLGPGPYSQTRGGPDQAQAQAQAQHQHQRRSQALSPQDQLRQQHAQDDGGRGAMNRRISRLESPSIMKSVLQPLEKKMNEYDRLMSEARGEMAQLDDELRALQERRQAAEERFLGAKSKYDDYSRQHDSVGRALRGEPDQSASMNRGLTSANMSGPPMHEPMHMQPMQRSVSFDERPLTPMSEPSMKPKGSKLRFSLFGKH